MTAIVSRIDHVVIETADEVKLFEWFHHTLGLPIAWPMAQWGMIHEGGINVGNCNIGCNHRLDPNAPAEPTIAAIAFEPHDGIEAALREMDARGLPHSDAMASGPIYLPHEPWNEGWTNALILRPTPISFVCEYHHDVGMRRHRQADGFARHENPLGILGAAEVCFNTSDPDGWKKLGRTFDEGPVLWIDESGQDGYWGMRFVVSSLEDATAAARARGIRMSTETGLAGTCVNIHYPGRSPSFSLVER